MNHDCRTDYLVTFEDKEGYLYIICTNIFGVYPAAFKVEYCPICGYKSKKFSTWGKCQENEFVIKE